MTTDEERFCPGCEQMLFAFDFEDGCRVCQDCMVSLSIGASEYLGKRPRQDGEPAVAPEAQTPLPSASGSETPEVGGDYSAAPGADERVKADQPTQEMFDPREMQRRVERLIAEGRMPTQEQMLRALEDVRARFRPQIMAARGEGAGPEDEEPPA